MTTPNVDACGAPGPLEIHSRHTQALVGEKVRLPLFSNRISGTLIRHEWSLISSPPSSGKLLAQPSGVTRLATSNTCERAYSDGFVPNFTADLPGLYVFEVRAAR